MTCEAPPRDPNQCELVDRPRYRKGPHICFDYNATVRGVQGDAGGAEPQGRVLRGGMGAAGAPWGGGVGTDPGGVPRGAELWGAPLGGN